jgi:hypothetical protein
MYTISDDAVVFESDVEVLGDDVVLDTSNMLNITEESNFQKVRLEMRQYAEQAPSIAFRRRKLEAERRASMTLGQRVGDFAVRGALGLATKVFSR